MKINYDLVVITGPTATGKTSFAANLAYMIRGEIISADSRQVYRNMDLGTGKDLDDYMVNSVPVPFHLINIAEPGTRYNVFQFQSDFLKAYQYIKEKNKNVILCGGSGMYIEAVLKAYKLINVPVNEIFRKSLETMTDEELAAKLKSMKTLHNTTDITTRKRLIRALEISQYYLENDIAATDFPDLSYCILGINFDRPQIRKRITERLKYRLDHGMIDEVQHLLKMGISPEDLIYYGLEYKYITEFILGKLSKEEMFQKLNTAIHQFAKRQMTWFRRMERQGMKIHWLDGYATMEEKLSKSLNLIC